MKRELAEAARESSARRSSGSPVSISEREELYHGSLIAGGTAFFGDDIPNKVHITFDAHDGEVQAVRWSPVDRIVATGGSDRKVKLWDVGKGKQTVNQIKFFAIRIGVFFTGNSVEPRGTLIGSNQAVNSLDFDSTGTLILGTSNDFASRVWSISDHRLRVSENTFVTLNFFFIVEKNQISKHKRKTSFV